MFTLTSYFITPWVLGQIITDVCLESFCCGNNCRTTRELVPQSGCCLYKRSIRTRSCVGVKNGQLDGTAGSQRSHWCFDLHEILNVMQCRLCVYYSRLLSCIHLSTASSAALWAPVWCAHTYLAILGIVCVKMMMMMMIIILALDLLAKWHGVQRV